MKDVISEIDFRIHAAFLGGFLITFIATSLYGVGLGPDSISYLSAGHQLWEQNGFYIYSGRLFVHWPPLFPVILAFITSLPVDETLLLRLLQSLTHGGIAALTFSLIRSEWSSGRSLLWVVFLFSVAQWPVLYLTKELYAGGLFLLFSLALAYSFNRWISHLDHTHVWGIILFLSLAMLQRYIGVTLWFTVAILLFLSYRHRFSISSYIHVLGIPATFLGIWLFRNQIITGTLTGERSQPFIGLLDNAMGGIVVLSKLLLPHAIPDLIRVVILSLMLVFLIWMITKYPLSDRLKGNALFQFSTLFSGTYLVVLWMVSSSGASDAMSFRLIAPIFPFLIISLFLVIDDLLSASENILFKIFFLTGFVLIVSYHAYFSFNLTRYATEYGAGGFNTRVWHESETMDWVKENASNAEFISNASDGIYAFTRYKTRSTPFRYQTNTSYYSRRYAGSYLVWFEEIDRQNLYPQKDLVEFWDLTIVEEFDDGTVYRFPDIEIELN